MLAGRSLMDTANLALRLDPKSAFAHAILGLKLATYDYDWAGAEQELERALAAESRDPLVLYNCSWLAFDIGRVDEALHLQDAALSLDPLNPDSLQEPSSITCWAISISPNGGFARVSRLARRSVAAISILGRFCCCGDGHVKRSRKCRLKRAVTAILVWPSCITHWPKNGVGPRARP